MCKDAKLLIIVPSINLVSQFYDEVLINYYGENNLEKHDYYIEVEKENGDILKLKPDDDVLTLNRGLIKAISLKNNDQL